MCEMWRENQFILNVYHTEHIASIYLYAIGVSIALIFSHSPASQTTLNFSERIENFVSVITNVFKSIETKNIQIARDLNTIEFPLIT